METFGQNRVQYRKFVWKYFDTKHFRVYHYDRSGVTLARYAAEQAERDIAMVEKKMSGTFPERFNIVLYNSYDEYRQSNIGLKFDSQIEGTATGTVDVVGDKLVVYFDGIHTDLRRQIRRGMSQVVMQRALFGDSFREVVKNSLLLNLPPWVSQGYIAYMVDGWDALSASEWKNLIAAHPKTGFYTLAESHPELAGKAFWKFVSDKYGSSMPKTILYAMQTKSSLNQGVKMTMGMKVLRAYDTCLAWFHEQYAYDSLHEETPKIDSALIAIKVPQDNGVMQNVRVSPRGQDVAYCIFRDGEYFIYIQKTLHEQVRSLIMQIGAKDFNETVADPNYPLLAWNNNGDKLAIMYQDKTATKLRIYNSQKARIENYVIPKNRFDRVLGMTFDEDNDQILFSAIRKSQTDLYSFTIKRSRMDNITNDIWDDIAPQFISGGSRRGILFLSNRPAANMDVPAGVNQLPTGPMNLYFYDTKTKSRKLLQCSYNKTGHITQPIQYGSDNFAFLMDTNGVQNKYVVTFVRKGNNYDSAVPVPVTNYSTSILNHQYNAAANQVADVLQIGKEYCIFFSPLLIPGKTLEPKNLMPTKLRMNELAQANQPEAGISSSGSTGTTLKSGSTFQSEFSDENTATPIATLQSDMKRKHRMYEDSSLIIDPNITDSTYLKLRARNYRLSFKPDFFQARLDNSVLFTQYQNAQLQGNTYQQPPLAGLISISLNDALEDQKITGGIRLPINFSGMTYFLQYQNFTNRVDWGVLALRSANFYNYDVSYVDSSGRSVITSQQLGKVTSLMLQGNAGYPLDRRRRLEATLGLRQDVLDFKAEDTLSLSLAPRTKSYWVMSRLEYVFDNSKILAMNIREGFRYKVYGEYLLGLSKSNNGGFYNMGFDFRYYKKLYKNCIFAFRGASAHSEGNQHILYFLGGTDGWIAPQSGTTPPVTDQNYAFQALASPLRGYLQNARNGNSYALANIELRMPILTTILKRPVNSSFLRNLQLVGFSDVGSAWNGILPNTANTTRNYLLSSPFTPVSLNVERTTNAGLALGYGAGLRSTLLGYFLRFDAAWAYDGLPKPIYYVSIGLDF
ncbi:MAG: hypothetical protein ABI378_08585 [Chitinophagaceae bacterium]